MSPDWAPSCPLERLRLRARMLDKIRRFFSARDVLEVETPLLSRGIGTDPNLDFFSTPSTFLPEAPELFLQTSPEFAMKRLLAAGSGSIYQISKAFRKGERGRYHNPEFTLLEWYRLDFDLSRIMQESGELLLYLLEDCFPIDAIKRLSYQQLFREYTGLEALQFDLSAYNDCAKLNNLPDAERICGMDHAAWLDFLFANLVQPGFEPHSLYFVYNYPACLPSLARRHPENDKLVERVEIFINGIELGNGYHELSDAQEQLRRFTGDCQLRERNGQRPVTPDQRLLDALAAGLPDCSGMALGLDRILMLASGSASIDEVLAFPVNRA